MRTEKRARKKVLAVLGAIAVIMIALWIMKMPSAVERKLISAIDRRCGDEGECELDLAEVFTDFQWDTVSLFIAGNEKQVRDALGLNRSLDLLDGIVFSDAGKPVKSQYSSFDWNNEVPALVSYGLERNDEDDLYYASLPYDHAVVHAQKYVWRDGNRKYYRLWVNPNEVE